MDAGVRASDALESAIKDRIAEVYGAALKKAVKNISVFLKKIKDVDDGKIKPPAFYNTPEKILEWRRGFTRELLRKENVIKNIETAMQQAGIEIEPEIRETMANVYTVNRAYMVDSISRKSGANLSFSIPSVREAEIILNDSMPVMSKIAYKNLKEAPAIMRRLQNEFAQATFFGESQQKIIKRIQKVMQNSASNAKTIAQTERTRVQSQARAETIHQAAEMGINVKKKWTARMINTRESHMDLDGEVLPHDEKFHTILGSAMDYPGDPVGKAADVINCHCILEFIVEFPEGDV